MSLRSDVEDIQTTRTEKLLAVVLAAFLLLGGLWTYQRIDNVVRSHVHVPYGALGPAATQLQAAQSRLFRAQDQRRRALQNLELRREAYRTALEAKKLAMRLERKYNAAQRELNAADRAVARAERAVVAARPAAEAAQRDQQRRIDAALHRQERDILFARLALTTASILAAFALLLAFRRRTTRWLPVAGSAVVAATILAFVVASDYLTDYINPMQWGVAAIAALGIVSTLVVYWLVVRYVVRRLPQRRVKHRQCPFCGYPVGDEGHCEGCGRMVVEACVKCDARRRVGTAFCARCGSP